MNFWNEIKKPVLCLAPMADVTDAAFRFIIAKYSKLPRTDLEKNSKRSVLGNFNYVTYTEFVSADGLVKVPEAGRKKLMKNLEYSEIERPIVAQFFTSKPEIMEKVAQLAVEFGFDGVDINMGCPDKSIEKQGAGAALMKNPKLAREIIAAAKRGVAEAAKKLNKKEIPISIKTRLGYNKDELETWLPELLAENPAAIIIHARTRKEMSKVSARWERIKRAVEIRDKVSRTVLDTRTLIIGNGDVENVADAIKKCGENGADGAMLGRAVFGQPWLLSNSYEWFNRKNDPKVVKKILEILVEHTKLFENKFKNIKSFAIMKKHFKVYLTGFPKAKELREKLMQAKDASEVEQVAKDFLVLYN